MAQKVSIVAQLCMDMFYQDFPTASSFFKKKHFVYYVVLADAKLKQDEYNLQVQINLRSRRANAPVVLNSENYYTARDLEVSKDNKILLPFPIMSFPGIGTTQSVSEVKPEGSCGNIMQTTQAQRWMAERDKEIVYWFPASAEDDKGCSMIEFLHKERCAFKKVDVTYIRSLTEKSTIQDARGWTIISMVTALFKAAKEGVVIDTSNDANPNVSAQTEINKRMIAGLQGR